MYDNIMAIVISDDHYNGLGMVRSLGEAGICTRLILTHVGKSFICKSRYIDKYIVVPYEKEKIVNATMSMVDANKRCFLFPLSDYSALILDQCYTVFPENVICPHAGGNLKKYLDKDYIKNIAESCGMVVPKGEVVELPNNELKWNLFPAIIKPLESVSGSKRDIVIVNDMTELKKALSIFTDKKYSKVLMEEYISGNDERMIEVLGERTRYGNIRFAGIIRKIREFPIKNGSTSYAKLVSSHNGVDLCSISKMLSRLNYKGLFDIEYKYSNGKAYFLECNFRNGAPSHILTKAGNNLAKAWIDDNLYNNTDITYLHDNYTFMVEQTDILNAIKGDVNIWIWFKQFFLSKKLFWSLRDPIPTLYYYWLFIKMRIKNT